MDITKEELQQLIKSSVQEALKEFFEQSQEKATAPPKPKEPTYQEVFDDVMAKVARGELSSDEAGEIITQAYDKQKVSTSNPSISNLSEKLNEFKTHLQDWEKELDHWSGRDETPVEMMERMKSKVQKKEEEAKLYADMKKIEEIEAQSKAEASLEEMKAKLRDK